MATEEFWTDARIALFAAWRQEGLTNQVICDRLKISKSRLQRLLYRRRDLPRKTILLLARQAPIRAPPPARPIPAGVPTLPPLPSLVMAMVVIEGVEA